MKFIAGFIVAPLIVIGAALAIIYAGACNVAATFQTIRRERRENRRPTSARA
jgi:hypothetical protein